MGFPHNNYYGYNYIMITSGDYVIILKRLFYTGVCVMQASLGTPEPETLGNADSTAVSKKAGRKVWEKQRKKKKGGKSGGKQHQKKKVKKQTKQDSKETKEVPHLHPSLLPSLPVRGDTHSGGGLVKPRDKSGQAR